MMAANDDMNALFRQVAGITPAAKEHAAPVKGKDAKAVDMNTLIRQAAGYAPAGNEKDKETGK